MATHTVLVRLTSRVPKIGNVGDVVNVPAGYARNFLLAKRLGVLSTPREAQANKLKQAAKQHAQTEAHTQIRTIARELDGKTATLNVSASAQGHTFASVQAGDVAAAFKTDPIFRMDTLKQIGSHQVILDFGHDITATVTVVLRPEPTRRS